MIRFKKPKFRFKVKKKTVAVSTLISLFVFIGVVPFNLNAGLSEIITGAIAFLIRTIANSITTILGPDYLNCGLGKLVFNVTGSFDKPTVLTDMNISLLRGNVLSSELFKLYNLFVYIAASLLGVIGLWVTFDFIKTAGDIRHKVVLKERLLKLIISIALLLSIPSLFDILLVINQTLVDVFRLFIVEGLGNTSDYSGAFLTDIFKQLSESNNNDIVLAVIYLMSGFINFWVVFFYMIRDLTICFLFIMAPIMVILLPYRTDLVLRWFKELCSNIFAQAVQAFVLTVIVAISTGLDNGTMYDKFFALAAFAMFIPLTATVKKMLGLEGEVGAAKSNAGLGAAIGAIGLAGALGAGLMKNGARIKSSVGDLRNIKGEESLLEKSDFGSNSVGSSVGSGSLRSTASSALGGFNSEGSGERTGGRGLGIDPNNKTSSNKNQNVDVDGYYDKQGGYSATTRARQLQGMKKNAKKEILKSVVGGVAGILGGGIMAAGTSVYGNPMASLIAAKGGAIAGEAIGETGASAVHSAGVKGSEMVDDAIYGQGIRYDGQENQALDGIFEGTVRPTSFGDIKSNLSTMKNNFQNNREIIKMNKENLQQTQATATGLDASTMNPTDYNKETSAILKRNSLERQGKFEQAHRSYAKNTYNRNNGVNAFEYPNVSASSKSDVEPLYGPQIPSPSILSPSVYPPSLPPISVPVSELFNNSGDNNSNKEIPSPMQNHTEIPVINQGQTTGPRVKVNPQASHINNTNNVPDGVDVNSNNPTSNNSEEDLVTTLQRDLNCQLEEYMNINEYMMALESCKADTPDMFLDNDDGQLF